MENKNEVKVWDIAIRVFHWSLVMLFAVGYITGEEESLVHIYSGYAVLGLVIFRIFWGMVGTRNARFSSFIFPPKSVAHYLAGVLRGLPDYYVGHNPAGGWMVLAMLLCLLVVSITGLKLYGLEGHGPLAAATTGNIELITKAHANGRDHDNEEEDEFWEEVHEASANLMLVLIAFHVVGVIVSGRIHKENLVKAMITGKKPVHKQKE
ncbi:MAG: cytochrome b/b6 domain-containing protein [Gammaproteobacteria bacterium]|nr:cytochrome b/b6 domain-containing protein [Gammaproteobacteria bacterium]